MCLGIRNVSAKGTHLSGKAYCNAWSEWGTQLHMAARDWMNELECVLAQQLLNLNKENSHVKVSEIT